MYVYAVTVPHHHTATPPSDRGLRCAATAAPQPVSPAANTFGSASDAYMSYAETKLSRDATCTHVYEPGMMLSTGGCSEPPLESHMCAPWIYARSCCDSPTPALQHAHPVFAHNCKEGNNHKRNQTHRSLSSTLCPLPSPCSLSTLLESSSESPQACQLYRHL